MIKQSSEAIPNVKREKIFEMITKLACKVPKEPIEVPEGLEGFGTIEHNLMTCVSCNKCKDLACEWNAITQNLELSLKDYLSYDQIETLPTNRKILFERLKKIANNSEPIKNVSIPEKIFFLGGMTISRANCVHCKKCEEICPTESMVSQPTYFYLAEALDTTRIQPYSYENTKEDLKNFEPEILTFFCHWCTYGGADLAGTSRMQYPPNTRAIRTTCTGRIDIQFILEALVLGADGVIVSGCLLEQCHYKTGNYKAIQRVTFLKRILDAIGFGGERISMHHISASMAPQFVEMINERINVIKKLGPNPLRGMNNRDRKSKNAPSTPTTNQQTISEVH